MPVRVPAIWLMQYRMQAAKIAKPAGAINTGGPLTNQRKDRIMATVNLTAQRLRELVHYDPETGAFTWAKGRPGCGYGKSAGSFDSSDGYWRMRCDGTTYKAHRLAWLYMTGEWPLQQVDHMDGNRANNRFANLRQASHSANQQNQRAAPISNKSCGLLGVTLHKPTGKWYSQIRFGGKRKYLGSFATAELAHEAYCEAKRMHHEGCLI